MGIETVDDSYDLVVVGSGPAGQVAAELAASFGRRALIVEQNRPGGVVTTTGGAPTKALREAALYLTGYRQEEVYGVRAAAPLEVVLPTLRARVEWVRDVLQDVVANRLAGYGITYLQGTARLGPDRTVHVTFPDGAERRVAAHAILLATGSRPAHPPGVPFGDPDVYDSTGSTRSDRLRRTSSSSGVARMASSSPALHRSRCRDDAGGPFRPAAAHPRRRAGRTRGRGVRAPRCPGRPRHRRGRGPACRRSAARRALDRRCRGRGRGPVRRRALAEHRVSGSSRPGCGSTGRGRIAVDHYYRTSARGSTLPATWFVPGSRRTRCSRVVRRRRTPAGWSSGWRSTRSQHGRLRRARGRRRRGDRGAGLRRRRALRRRPLRPGRHPARSHRGSRRSAEADLPGGRPQAVGVHCFGDIASEVVGMGRSSSTSAAAWSCSSPCAQHPDIQLRLQRRSGRRADPAHPGDGSRRRLPTRRNRLRRGRRGDHPTPALAPAPRTSAARPRTPQSPTDPDFKEVSHGRPLLRPAGHLRPRLRRRRRVHLPSPERPGHLVLVMDVFPAATVAALFSDALSYRFRLRTVTARPRHPDVRRGPRRVRGRVTFVAPDAAEGGDLVQVGRCTAAREPEFSFRVGDAAGEAPGVRIFAGAG